MSRLYYKYNPRRAGLTGAEFIESFLDSHYPGVSWDAVISKDLDHYGVLVGSGDPFSLACRAIEGTFSAVSLQEDSFVGECYLVYLEQTYQGKPDFRALLNQHGFEFLDLETDLDTFALPYVKRAKEDRFKEITKRLFYDYNDLCADITKAVVVLSIYYPNLTAEERATVDSYIAVIKAAYPVATAINGMGTLVSKLQEILTGYYSAKVQLASAATVADAAAVVYE